MRHLLNTVQASDIVKCVDAGAQATVEAEYLIIDESGKRQVVEEIGEVFPYIGIPIFA